MDLATQVLQLLTALVGLFAAVAKALPKVRGRQRKRKKNRKRKR